MVRKVLIHTRNLAIPGGKQSYLIALKDYFKNDVSYFFYGTQKPVKESKIAFIKRFFGDYFKFYRQLKKGNFDVVHINTSFNLKSYFRDSIFTLISAMLKVKTVVYWHGWRWDFEKKYASKIIPFFHFTFGKADAMVCLANEFSQRLKEYGYKKPVYLETTVVEDNIINPKNGINTLESLAAKNGHKVILFLSRVEKAKGIYETIDSFQKIQNKFPQVVLNIAGTGSELEKVKKYVSENRVEGINFLGWIDGEQKVRALYDSDIFVLASYSEGMPICVLEAMASGKSVVTTDVGGIKDFFEDGRMGLKVKVKDSVDLEQKFEKLLSNPELMERIGSYNTVYAKERFSAAQVAKRLESIYEDAISGSSNNQNSNN
jgi:glycosyltransferase involved in cell wall biosynthesis